MTLAPAAIKAAWVEARRWWPRKVVEVQAGQKVAEAHYFRVVETAILVDEPTPGFREAIEAAMRHKEDR